MVNTVSNHRISGWLKVIFWIVGIIIFLPLFIVLLFQLSPVQNFARSKVEAFLRNKFHTTVLIGKLKLTWWNSLSIKKIFLADRDNKALLYSGSLDVSFNLLDLINNKLVVKKLDWDDVLVNIYRLPGDSNYNYQFIVDAFAPTRQTDTLNESGTTLTYSIGDIAITHCRFRFADAPSNMLAIAMWQSLLIKPETVRPESAFYDVNELAIKNAKFIYDDRSSGTNTSWNIPALALNDVVFDSPNKTIEAGDIKIHRMGGNFSTKPSTTKDTVTNVIAIDTTVKTAWAFKVKNIDLDQLGFKFDNVGTPIKRNELDFNHLAVNNIRLQANELGYSGDSIFLNLDELMLRDKSGLAIEKAQGQLLYNPAAIVLKDFLLQADLKPIIDKKIDLSANIEGSLAHLNINTLDASDNDGTKIYASGTIDNLDNPSAIAYDLNIPVLKANVGKIIKNPTIGLVNASVSAKGKGYDYKTLVTNAHIIVKEAVYNNYRYHSINSNLLLNRGRFDLLLQSKDPNVFLTTQLKGLLNTNGSLSGTIDAKKVDLYATHWTTSPLAAKVKAIIDIPSFQPKHLNGRATFSDIQIADDSSIYALDTLQLLATDTINQQQINISGPFGFLKADGQYDYTTAFTDLVNLVQQHLQAEQSSAIITRRQIMDLQGSLLWPRSLQHLAPGLNMRKPLSLSGHLNTDSSLLIIDFLLPGITFNDFKLDTLRGSINNNADELLAKIYLAALEHPQFPLEQTTLDIAAKNGILDADLSLLDKNDRQKYALGTSIKFLPNNGLSLSLKPALLLNKTSWTVSDGNSIVLAEGALRSADLSISSRGQALTVKTSESGNATPDLKVTIDQFKLSTISAAIEQDSLFAEGVLSADATISNYTTTPAINATLSVDSLRAMNIAVGTLNASINSPKTGIYDVKAQLTGSNNDVDITGRYAEQMDFNIDLKRLNMASIEPFTMGNVKRMSGTTSGEITVKGTASEPIVRGTLHFDTVAGNITAIGNYLKIPNNDLAITNEGITFNNFVITDSLNHEAVINGSIRTKDYKDYRLQLTLDAENFMAVGPKQSPDQLFYGPTFIDANAKIRGNQDLPRIDLNLVLRDSTSFTMVVPENDPGIASREGVIIFVDKDTQLDSALLSLHRDTLNLQKTERLKGMALNARVEITPTSTLKIIVDQQNGDYLEVKGKANLDATMTPNSDLTLTGRYELDEGKYNMSLNNFIKRTFNIEKGSSITFQGNVMDALVDITARYRVNAVAGDLVEDQLSGASDIRRNQFKQKVPVDVYLQIKNELLKPEISFRLDMPERDRNVLNGVIYNRIKQINGVESELNKQVMGLLVLNSFIPENPVALINERGGSGVEGTAKKSVSKLISQQLNNFAGSLVKGFNINFDLNTEDDYTTGALQSRTDLNIGVSKSLFNDRVSVSVGSSVNLEGTPASQQTSNLVGDVSVDYKITPDGKYRLRAYRQNETDAIVEGQIIETGASFIFTVDYNELRELFHSKKKEAGIIKKRGK